MRYLLRYGEIGLKSDRVRRRMKQGLLTHIRELLRREGGEGTLFDEEGRLFLTTDYPGVDEVLSRTFGLVSFSPVRVTDPSLESLVRIALDMAGGVPPEDRTFAVRVRRVGDHAYTSMDVARRLGREILETVPSLQVDLTAPDWELFVEIRGEKAYLTTRVMKGPGGLPLGTQGKVVAYVEEPDGILAAWLMMKRGCRCLPVFLTNDRWARTLDYWDPDSEPRQITDLDEMGRIADESDAKGYVYPGDLDAGEEAALRPAFYPLLGVPSEIRAALQKNVLTPLGLA